MPSQRLRLEVSNFGPVRRGEIELRPLTLLIGPNNSGKSYLAQLIYGLCSLISPSWPQRPRISTPFTDYLGRQDDMGPFGEFLRTQAAANGQNSDQAIRDLSHKELAICSEALSLFENRVSERLLWLIPQYFGGRDLSAMKNSDAPRSGVKVSAGPGGPEREALRLELRQRPKLPRWQHPNLTELPLPKDWLHVYESMDDPSTATFWLGQMLWTRLLKDGGFPTSNLFYMPAGRSGLIAGAQTVTSYIISTIRQTIGREALFFPALNGVVGDFYQDFIDTEPSRSRARIGPPTELASVKDFLNGQLLDGHVDYLESPLRHPRLSYSGQRSTMPLELASSMIQELAPLDLWIKQYLRPGDVVFIDEPEAHLHPENQRLVARLLVRLANAGITVVAPTHSSWILNQVSNCMIAESVKHSAVDRFGLEDADLIELGNVGVYLFVPEARGTVVREVRIDSETGIPEDEFLRVADAIGEQSQELAIASMETERARETA